MSLHRTLLMLTVIVLTSAAVGCEEWRNTGPQYPARNDANSPNMSNSQWRSSGGSGGGGGAGASTAPQ